MMDTIKEATKGNKNCKLCGGTGYYTTYTDSAAEDGGEYSNTHVCRCTKTLYKSKKGERK